MNLSQSRLFHPSCKWISGLALLAAVFAGPFLASTLGDGPKAGACCASVTPGPGDAAAASSGCAGGNTTANLSEKWGIEVVALRLSAGGNLLDFRYKVLDSDKAAPISHVEWKPYLIDEKTGAKMVVPKMPKIGSLRQTAVKPVVGRVFTTLFTNPGQTLKSGSKATVVIGECRIENLTVQ
jgi:hypothetical protein